MDSLPFFFIYTGKSAYSVIVIDQMYFDFVVNNPKLCVLDGIVLFIIVPQPSLKNFGLKTGAFEC
jgi:hypothetical protein